MSINVYYNYNLLKIFILLIINYLNFDIYYENKYFLHFFRLLFLIAGVGVRHALFPIGTRLGALAFAGGVLPDATLRGMRMFRSHGGTVPTVAGRNLRVRPLRPVRTLPAGSGAPDVVLTRLQFWCFASAPLPRGRRQFLAGRWPRATGLTSYL